MAVGETCTYTGLGSIDVRYRFEGSLPYALLTASVTITSYGDVIGTIEGTFTATANDGESDIDVTGGKFKVKRIADDTGFPPWA